MIVSVCSCSFQLLGDLSMESDVDEGSQSMSIKESILPTAAEVHISIILSPNYSPGASYTEALRSYFLLPRYVSQALHLSFGSLDKVSTQRLVEKSVQS